MLSKTEPRTFRTVRGSEFVSKLLRVLSEISDKDVDLQSCRLTLPLSMYIVPMQKKKYLLTKINHCFYFIFISQIIKTYNYASSKNRTNFYWIFEIFHNYFFFISIYKKEGVFISKSFLDFYSELWGGHIITKIFNYMGRQVFMKCGGKKI